MVFICIYQFYQSQWYPLKLPFHQTLKKMMVNHSYQNVHEIQHQNCHFTILKIAIIPFLWYPKIDWWNNMVILKMTIITIKIAISPYSQWPSSHFYHCHGEFPVVVVVTVPGLSKPCLGGGWNERIFDMGEMGNFFSWDIYNLWGMEIYSFPWGFHIR